MREGFRIYDTHTHMGTARHSGRQFSAARMIEHMERTGVDRSMVIPWPVVDDYRAAHDEIARAVRENPLRLSAAACLNPFVPEQEFRDEVRRCAEDLGFRALKLQPQYQALNPLSERSDFLFEAALRSKLVLIAHTGSGIPFSLPSLFIAAARRFPDLPIVLAHAGSPVYMHEAIVAAMVCPNIYIELSSLAPHHVLEVLRHVPPSRLMIGSDLPESVVAEVGKIAGLEIPREDREQILWNTPARLFDGES